MNEVHDIMIRSTDLADPSLPSRGLRVSRLTLATVAIAFAAALGHAAPGLPAVEAFPLSANVNASLNAAVGSNMGPEGEWNRQRGAIAGFGIHVLVPNDQAGVPSREEEILKLAKDLFAQTVEQSEGAIAGWAADGTLYGIEFAIFGDDDPVPAPLIETHLGTVGELAGLDANGQPAVLGRMYCYDYVQYLAREALLATLSGGTTSAESVLYPGPVIQASSSSRYALHLNTDGTSVVGDVLSNGGLRIDGVNDTLEGRLRAVEGVQVSGSGHVLGALVAEPAAVPLPSPPRSAAQYRNLALANSTFFDQSLTIADDGSGGFETNQGVPVSGVVYSTGDVTLACSGAAGSLTLVAEGSIELAGSANQLTAAVDELLFWAIDDADPDMDKDVLVSGGDNTLTGELQAPGGSIQLLGDGTDLTGNLAGWRVLVSGDGITIGDGTAQ